ncbi:hypothetical protein L3Q82_014167, partial [Scortum barcoo]
MLCSRAFRRPADGLFAWTVLLRLRGDDGQREVVSQSWPVLPVLTGFVHRFPSQFLWLMASRSLNVTLFVFNKKDNTGERIKDVQPWFNAQHSSMATVSCLTTLYSHNNYQVAQCPAESSACIQISRPALNWPLCPSLQIQIIKANAVPLCTVAMGTGTVAAS